MQNPPHDRRFPAGDGDARERAIRLSGQGVWPFGTALGLRRPARPTDDELDDYADNSLRLRAELLETVSPNSADTYLPAMERAVRQERGRRLSEYEAGDDPRSPAAQDFQRVDRKILPILELDASALRKVAEFNRLQIDIRAAGDKVAGNPVKAAVIRKDIETRIAEAGFPEHAATELRKRLDAVSPPNADLPKPPTFEQSQRVDAVRALVEALRSREAGSREEAAGIGAIRSALEELSAPEMAALMALEINDGRFRTLSPKQLPDPVWEA